MQAGVDNCYFLLNVDQNVLKNTPNFDRNQMPDINTSGWFAQFNQYWQQNGTGSTGSTGTGTSGAGSASATETPSTGTGSSSSSGTSGTGAAAVTETPSASTGSTSGSGSSTGTTGGATAQANNRLILADELLGMNVVSGNATSSTGTSTSGTGSATSTETAGVGATSTETAGSGTSGTAAAGETLGAITDAIVDLQTGFIRYYLVTGDTTMGAANGMLIPIPPQAFSFPAADTSNSPQGVTLNVNNMVLSQAPTFDEGTLPNATLQGWDTGLNNFWSSQGFNSTTNP
jgi:hypothetical protein